MVNPEIVRFMRGLRSAWRASAWWLKISIIIVVYLILRSILSSFFPSSEPTPKIETVTLQPSVSSGRDYEDTARHSCSNAIIAAAINKSSVDFHSLSYPPKIRKLDNGKIEVFVKFSAKNGFGAESVSIARCLLEDDAKTLIDLQSVDSR